MLSDFTIFSFSPSLRDIYPPNAGLLSEWRKSRSSGWTVFSLICWDVTSRNRYGSPLPGLACPLLYRSLDLRVFFLPCSLSLCPAHLYPCVMHRHSSFHWPPCCPLLLLVHLLLPAHLRPRSAPLRSLSQTISHSRRWNTSDPQAARILQICWFSPAQTHSTWRHGF